ncbi:MAG TPA: VWA domain-containing protein [Thermoanaerobaculia bacterium]|nr:VWA domain-containing protein [Thermoanaerobaculia bacterium]
MRRFAVALALLTLAIPTFAQQPQTDFREEIDVNAVLLDVIVTDSRGNHILGLGPDDFVVKENGVAQPVDSVDYFTNRRLLEGREEQAAFKVERVREDRYFIFFFDKPSDPGVLFDQVTLAREAVRDFVKTEMKETDHVAIAGHDFRLKVYSDFTNDKKQLDRALTEASKFGRGIKKANAEGPSILRNAGNLDKTGTVYEALDAIGDSVRSIRARKNLVLFSPGIVARDETIRGEILLNRSRFFDPALQSLNTANVAVYPVQLQRDAVPTPYFHQRLSEVADSTGGQYFQFVTNFRTPVNRIDDTNSGYYLVTYRSKHPSGAKGYQKVDVSLRNPEFKVVARSGYQYGG